MPIDHAVMVSGGLMSWMAARLLVDEVGKDRVICVFADTMIEDEDTYRFLNQSLEDLGCGYVILRDGRNPWEVFRDVRFVGNTRADPCSRILKRDLCRSYLDREFPCGVVKVCLGIHAEESHRREAIMANWQPYPVRFLLCEQILGQEDIEQRAAKAGLARQRLYTLGFPHANCGGFCIKAGHAQFRLLLEKFPDRYRWHEEKEEELRRYLGKDVAILRDRRGGTTKPLPMVEFRRRIERDKQDCDLFDWGGCGCFTDGPEEVNP